MKKLPSNTTNKQTSNTPKTQTIISCLSVPQLPTFKFPIFKGDKPTYDEISHLLYQKLSNYKTPSLDTADYNEMSLDDKKFWMLCLVHLILKNNYRTVVTSESSIKTVAAAAREILDEKAPLRAKLIAVKQLFDITRDDSATPDSRQLNKLLSCVLLPDIFTSLAHRFKYLLVELLAIYKRELKVEGATIDNLISRFDCQICEIPGKCKYIDAKAKCELINNAVSDLFSDHFFAISPQHKYLARLPSSFLKKYALEQSNSNFEDNLGELLSDSVFAADNRYKYDVLKTIARMFSFYGKNPDAININIIDLVLCDAIIPLLKFNYNREDCAIALKALHSERMLLTYKTDIEVPASETKRWEYALKHSIIFDIKGVDKHGLVDTCSRLNAVSELCKEAIDLAKSAAPDNLPDKMTSPPEPQHASSGPIIINDNWCDDLIRSIAGNRFDDLTGDELTNLRMKLMKQ
jgi:hypothetical protein